MNQRYKVGGHSQSSLVPRTKKGSRHFPRFVAVELPKDQFSTNWTFRPSPRQTSSSCFGPECKVTFQDSEPALYNTELFDNFVAGDDKLRSGAAEDGRTERGNSRNQQTGVFTF